jgi:predicted acylesterase/phospholipase RssA
MRILNIEGGGIRGLMPSVVLNMIAELSGYPISELFDLFVGTSTGSIIATILTAPDVESERPLYNTSHLLEIYEEECMKVFSVTRWRNFSSVYGIYGERYSTKARDALLQGYLKEIKLSQTLKPLMVPSFELNRRLPVMFKSRKAQLSQEDDYLLSDILGAALAAPTIFPPYALNNRTLIDGLHLKNPVMAGIAEALKHGSDYGHGKVLLEDIWVLSLGTGFVNDDPPSPAPTSGFGFLIECFNAVINANTISSQYIAQQLLGERILHVDFGLPERNMSICDVSKENILRLKEEGEKGFWDNVDGISKFLHHTNGGAAVNFDGNIEAIRASRIALPEVDDQGL